MFIQAMEEKWSAKSQRYEQAMDKQWSAILLRYEKHQENSHELEEKMTREIFQLKKDAKETNRKLKIEKRRVKFYQRLHLQAKEDLVKAEKISDTRRRIMISLAK